MKLAKFLDKKAAIVIFISSFVVRSAVALGYASGFFNGGLKGGDSHLYFEIAHNLINGRGFATDSGPTAFVSPLYPIFLAGCISIFGENLLLISIIQSILSALVCVCIYKSAKLIFENHRIGVIAGIISTFSFEMTLWSNAQLLTEPLYVFLFAVAILFLVLALVKPRAKHLYFALSGAVFAFAALTRPTAIAIAFGLVVILFFSSFFRRSLSWKHSIYFLCAFSLMMFPWGIRNYFVFDSFTISSLEGGHVLWLGNNPQYDKYNHPDLIKYGGYTTMFRLDNNLGKQLHNKSAVEQNRIFANAAWDHIKSSPIAFLKRAAHKNWNMWRPNFSVSSTRNKLISYTFYPFILLTALIGIFLAWRRSEENLFKKLSSPESLLTSILLMHILIHSIITGEIRFRVPLWIILIPFSVLLQSFSWKPIHSD